MNPRAPIIFVSLVANLALSWLAWRELHPALAPPRALPNEPVTVATAVQEVQTNERNAVVNLAERFDWSRLASADWKQYRDRLRAVGCPEKTVRAVIIAEIEEEFMHRRQALLDEFQRRFWEKLASRELDDHEAVDEPIRKLDNERRHLIEEVLGPETPDPDREAKQMADRKLERERSLKWLPPEKRQRLIDLLNQLDADSQALAKEIGAREKSGWTDDDRARQKQLEAAAVQARKTLLTADEEEEWELRQSNTAHWASWLPGLEVSEDEWRAGAKIRRDYEAAVAKLAAQPEPDPEKRRQLDDALAEQMKSALGAEQFARYQAANDAALQLTRRITARFQLPDSLAEEVAAIQKQASAAGEQIINATDSSPADRAAALAAVREETLRSLQSKLSGDVWTTYQHYNGDWIKRLSVPPSE